MLLSEFLCDTTVAGADSGASGAPRPRHSHTRFASCARRPRRRSISACFRASQGTRTCPAASQQELASVLALLAGALRLARRSPPAQLVSPIWIVCVLGIPTCSFFDGHRDVPSNRFQMDTRPCSTAHQLLRQLYGLYLPTVPTYLRCITFVCSGSPRASFTTS